MFYLLYTNVHYHYKIFEPETLLYERKQLLLRGKLDQLT